MALLRSCGLLLALAAGLLATGAAQAGCQLEKVATLPVKIDKGRIFIPGAIDGTPVDFMVDLASRTTLLRIAAERMDIRPNLFGALDQIATFGPPGPDQFSVAHLQLRLASGTDNFGAPDQVALLGGDFFGFYDTEFDIAHGKIVLYKPDGCETANLGYWPGTKSVADMVSNIANPLSNQYPFTSYNFPHVNIRLKVGGKEMLAAIDTGYADSSLNLAAAHSLGLTPGGDGTSEAERTYNLLDGHSTPTWIGTVASVEFGQETIAPAMIRFRTFMLPEGTRGASVGTLVRPSRYNGEDMMLGADFFIAHRVFLSLSQKKVYFSAAEGSPFL